MGAAAWSQTLKTQAARNLVLCSNTSLNEHHKIDIFCGWGGEEGPQMECKTGLIFTGSKLSVQRSETKYFETLYSIL